MSRFINETIADVRGGRETWRVFLTMCGPALVIAVVLALR